MRLRGRAVSRSRGGCRLPGCRVALRARQPGNPNTARPRNRETPQPRKHGIPSPPRPFRQRMKRLALTVLALCLASASFAADEPEAKTNEKPAPPLGARADKMIKDALPKCSEP